MKRQALDLSGIFAGESGSSFSTEEELMQPTGSWAEKHNCHTTTTYCNLNVDLCANPLRSLISLTVCLEALLIILSSPNQIN